MMTAIRATGDLSHRAAALRSAKAHALTEPEVIAFCIFFPDVVRWLPKLVLPESVGSFKNPSGPGYACP